MNELYHEEPIEGIPVEFKEINPEDFNEFYNVEEKIIVEVNEEGYLDERFSQLLDDDLTNTNTTIINAGVGQGKSTHIIEKAISFASNSKYYVIVAVPFNNLIDQYYEDFCKKFNKYRVFSLLKIEEAQFLYPEKRDLNIFSADTDMYYFTQHKISNYKINIVTANSLLGNPGEESLFQSGEKRRYFQKLVTYCKKNDKKIVIIFDEIHDSIINFKEEYIINLWKYYGIVHKIYVVSATFNEASKEVIKYLSEFTEKKIRIIESKRTIVSSKQSRLHLIFNDSKSISKNERLKTVLKEVINNNSPFDIIVYSRRQVEQLLDNDPLNYIKYKINNCYSDIFDDNANKKYSKEQDIINVGTNFTTGVNIEHDNNHLFIILPKRLNLDFVNNKGIFNSGLNAVIQIIARQRKVGDIYVILSSPYYINKDSLPYEESIKNEIIKRFQRFRAIKGVHYSHINSQNEELSTVYEKLKQNVQFELETILNTDRRGMNPLNFPTKTRFILEKGEKYLSSIFFGGDLSTYVYFAAITNQFLNCRLESINYMEDLYYDSENLTLDLLLDYQQFVFDYPLPEGQELYNFEDIGIFRYTILKSLIEYYLKRKCFIDNSVDKNHRILQIITLYVMFDSFIEVSNIDDNNKHNDVITEYYFKSGVKFSSYIDINNPIELSNEQIFIINFFKNWNQFLEIIDLSIQNNNKLAKKPFEEFVNIYHHLNFSPQIDEFNRTDLLTKNNIINFSDNWRKKKTDEKKIEFFYKTSIELFYNFEDKQIVQENGARPRMYTEIEKKDWNNLHNLLFDIQQNND